MGLGSVAALYKKVPKMTPFEKKLVSLGLAVPSWSQYSSISRLTIEPESGHCYWYGTPGRLEMGYSLKDAPATADGEAVTQLTSGQAKLSTPNNADLFQIFVHQVARHVNDATTYKVDGVGLNMASQWQQMASLIGLFEEDPEAKFGFQTASLYQELVSPRILKYVQGMNVRQFNTVKLENVSNLEAFIDCYELVYDHSDRQIGDQLYYTLDTREGKNYFGGGARYGHAQDPFYGSDFAACMLNLYALECIKARPRIGANASSVPLQAREHERTHLADTEAGIGYLTTAQTETEDELRQVLFCHPRNNPLEAWPKGVRNHSGFKLRKVGKRMALKPAEMMVLRNKDKFFWSFNESPVGKEILAADGTDNWDNATSRRIPNRFRIKFYRYWGDMIQSKNAGVNVSRLAQAGAADEYGDRNNTDFQSGTCSIMVQTERVVHVRLDSRIDSRLVPWPEPFDKPVAYADQFHIDHDGNFDLVARKPA